MRWMGKKDGHDDDPYGWLAFPSLKVLTPLYGTTIGVRYVLLMIIPGSSSVIGQVSDERTSCA